MIRSLYI